MNDLRPAHITVQRRKDYDDWIAFWGGDQRKHEASTTQAGAVGGLVMNYGRALLGAPTAEKYPDSPHEWVAYWGGRDRWAGGRSEKEAIGYAVLHHGMDLLRPTHPLESEIPLPKAVITVELVRGTTREQAVQLAAAEFWKHMPEREALLFQLLNPSHLACMSGDRMRRLLEHHLGPVRPEQRARPDLLAEELLRRMGEPPRSWVSTFRQLPPVAKRIMGLHVPELESTLGEVLWLVSGPDVRDSPSEHYAWTGKGALRKYRRESGTRWGRGGLPELYVERAGADYLSWKQEQEDRADAMSY